ncbi:MAG: hypothetical protein EP306_02730 [Burkholderiales bacterium]|nr:MAG: hypothetical protein EP306_02730 [Burkholderiales bacterium]
MNPGAPSEPANMPMRRPPRPVWWLLLWLPAAAVAAVLSAVLVVWIWAGSTSSLGQALRWAEVWLEEQPTPGLGRLRVEGAEGSLRRGGQVALLRWEQDGLSVQAEGVRLELPDDWLITALTRRHLEIGLLHTDRLSVRDERRADDRETGGGGPAPTDAVFPVTMRLPWSVDRLDLPGEGDTPLLALRGLYRYGSAPDGLGTSEAHQLRLDSLRWADGLYQGEWLLGAQSPMPLQVQATGEVRVAVPDGLAQHLVARMQANGSLAGSAATIDLQLQLNPAHAPDGQPPLLDAQARIRPWDQRQVLEQLDAQVHGLDLAGLWPDAPRTALSGEARLSTRDAGWQARVSLSNASPAPLDRRGLPVQELRADLNRTATHWELPVLEARLGEGRLTGQARVTAGDHALWLGAWDGLVQLERIDPARIWSQLAPGRADAQIRARSIEAAAGTFATEFSGRLSNTVPATGRQRPDALPLDELTVRGRWQAPVEAPERGQLQLASVTLRALGLDLEGQTRLDLSSRELAGRLKLRAPGLSADWTGDAGAMRGEGELKLDLADGATALQWLRSLQAAPWIGPDLAIIPDTLGLEGPGRLDLRWQGGLGALGYPGGPGGQGTAAQALTLALDLSLPRLQLQTGPQEPVWRVEAGQLRLAGPPRALDMELKASVSSEALHLSVDTRGRLEPSWPASARGITTATEAGRWLIERLDIRAGLPAQSPLDWQVTSDAPVSAQWQRRDEGWQLATGPVQLRLQPQTRGGAGQQPVRLGWERMDWDRGALSTRGTVQDLPLAWLDLLSSPQDPDLGALARTGIRSDLLMQGRWDVQLPAGARALPQVLLELERQRGDLTLRTDSLTANGPTGTAALVAAGVRTARLEVASQGRAVRARLVWDSERLGQIDARVDTELTPPDGTHQAWHWAPQAPVSGSLRARLPEVGAWSVLAPPGWRIQGALEAEAGLSGTRQEPQWLGQLRADDLAVRSVVDGFAFSRGSLRASLAGDRLLVESLTLQGPGSAGEGGELEASGSAQWRAVVRDGQRLREPLIELKASARQLRVSTRPDRRLTLSGQLQARLEGALLDIRGRLAADNALFLLPDELTPSLGQDVVVRGRGAPLPPDGARVQTRVEVDIDLGRRFEVRGQGIATQLGGQLTVRSTPALPGLRVLGEVRARSGTYRAYGQQLNIETGVLRFSGPYDDPALDIVAVRPNLRDQRVGVQILGTAQRPQLRLFSEPELPDSEKLAWLLLGRPATGTGAETAILQQATLALLAGQSEGAGGQLAGLLGLDELGLVDRGEGGDAISVGKRFSNRLYVSYEYGLVSTLGTVSVLYEASRWLTLRGRAGEENALDLLFTRDFD